MSIPISTKKVLGFLLQPYCMTGPRFRVSLLAVSEELRDYIYISQLSPTQLPLPPAPPALWSANNLGSSSETSLITITVSVPDQENALNYQVDQHGSEVLLGVRPPWEYGLTLSLEGQVIGILYSDLDAGSPPPPPPYLLPPPPSISYVPHDFSWPPDYVWTGIEFLWPSQVHTFVPWFYVLYSGVTLPLMDQIPYIRTY